MVSVPKLWPGATIACVASGPSLTAEDVNALHGRCRVICVNDTYKLAPWADVLYAADQVWWKVHQPTFAGLKVSIERSHSRQAVPSASGILRLQNTGHSGLDLNPSGLHIGISPGHNGGYQAINLAVHLGAARIVLLGYDMQLGPKGELHWFGKHPKPLSNHHAFAASIKGFQTLVQPLKDLGIPVVNCTRRTALRVFPCQPLEEVLRASKAA